MTNEQQKALDLLRQYREIKTREAEVERWLKHINDDLARLYDQQSRAEAEAKLIAKKLEEEFSEFETADFLNLNLQPEDVGNREIKEELKNSQRVNKETKDTMFKLIVEAHLFGDPNAEFPTISFDKIRDELKKNFSVETDNLTQFFRDQFSKCFLFGGTRNRHAWVPMDFLNISVRDYEERAEKMKRRLEDDETLNPKPWK